LACTILSLPNFIWQVRNHFPFLELIHNIRMGNRDVVRGPVAFIADQAMILDPVLFPLWAGGLIWLFFGGKGRRYRVLGWAFVVVLGTFIALKAKNYYVLPVYPMLLAAGAAGLEQLMRGRRLVRWGGMAYAVLIIAAAVTLAPYSMPILPPESFIRYQA